MKAQYFKIDQLEPGFKEIKIEDDFYYLYPDGRMFKGGFISNGDLVRLLKVRTKKLVYPCYDCSGKVRKIHRLLAEHFIPNPDNKPFVDHINRDKFDYRLENLRWVSFQENTWNRTKKKKATSKYIGVSLCNNKYRSQITFNKKLYHLGDFKNEIDAALAYNKKAEEFGMWTRNEI